jgi:hypothetical protein
MRRPVARSSEPLVSIGRETATLILDLTVVEAMT